MTCFQVRGVGPGSSRPKSVSRPRAQDPVDRTHPGLVDAVLDKQLLQLHHVAFDIRLAWLGESFGEEGGATAWALEGRWRHLRR